MKKKLFVIASRVPYPLDKGDKLRLYHQLRFLNHHFEILLCCLDDTGEGHHQIEQLNEIVPKAIILKLPKWKIYLNMVLGIFGSKPLQVYYFYQRSAQKKINNLIEEFKPDFIYSQLIRSTEYVKHQYHIPKTLDYQDAFSKGVERRIDQEKWRKKIFQMEHKRLIKYENLIYEYFDHHTIISEEDRNAIMHEKRNLIEIIPNGIDTEFFLSKDKTKVYDLLFVGNMSYAPNIVGAQYIANEILPLLVKQFPDLKMMIAGANPSAEVMKLANDNIIVSGWLEDIRDAYNSSKVFVAPMQIGSGLQNKLLEAMSMELPCVTSKLANQSLKAIPDRQVLIGTTPESYAELITNLLQNELFSNTMGKSGRQFVQEHYSWEDSSKKLAEIIENVNPAQRKN